MIDRVGQQFGNYRLTRLLGRGGFADVYLGQHLRLNMQVAIKVLHTQLADDDVESFYHEAQIIASLSHPHIVRLLDFDVQDGIPFLVLDYASNDSLRRRHPKGILIALPLVVSYVNQVAAALQYAHDQKIIHRDVKPENILVGRQNEILLSDFGLAIIVQSSSFQGIENIAGTITYMAPEQIQGHPRLASDQYSLGAVVYEWLCGERLFHGSLAEMTVKHTMVPPRPMREKVPTIAPEVEQVVLKALAKNPKQRFDSVQEFATALEQASRATQLTVSAPSTMVSSQPLQPHTIASSEVESSQVAVNAVLANVSAQSNETIISPDQETPPLVPTSPGPEFSKAETIASTNETIAMSDQEKPSPIVVTPSRQSPQPSSSPKIRRELEVSHRGISRRDMLMGLGLTGLVVVGGGIAWLASSRKPLSPSVSDHTFTPLYVYPGHVDPIRTVMWSPDGRRIASGSDDGKVQVWDATDGSHAYTYRGHSNRVTALAWSPDGRQIASASYDKTVQVWDATDGSHIYTYRGHSNYDVHTVAWSPDGRRIASGGNDRLVQVWDATDGGHAYTYRGHFLFVLALAWSPHDQRIASGSADRTVQVWNATDGGHLYTYHGHSDWVNAVAWSPHDQRIASGSNDKTIQVWNAADGGHLYTYHGHSDWVNAVAWSPDSTRIASGSNDKTVQVWNAM